MNHNQRATIAIELWIINSPQRADLEVWRLKNPSTDWGMTAPNWRGVAKNIIDQFNLTAPGGTQIDPNAADTLRAIKKLFENVMGEFHRYLTNKASLATLPNVPPTLISSVQELEQ